MEAAKQWKWFLILVPGGVVVLLVVRIWQVVRSEEFRRDVERLRENRRMRIAARRRKW